MKRLALLMLMALSSYFILAVDVYLYTGEVVKADNVKMVDGKVVVTFGHTETTYTTAQVNAVKDGKQDITQDTIGQESYGTGVDDQNVPENTYFTSNRALGDNQQIGLTPAKLVREPDKDNNAGFLDMTYGHSYETSNYYKSEIADPAKLTVNQEVIVYQNTGDDGINRGPKDMHDVRYGNWIMSTISDISHIDEGYVVLSNGQKVSTGDVRIVSK